MTALILTTNVFAHLLGPLARRLRKEFELKSVLVAANEREVPDAKRADFRPTDFAEIVYFGDRIEPAPMSALREAEVASRAAALEARTGVSALDIVRGDRHLGMAFATNVNFFRSGLGSRITHLQALDIAIRFCSFAEELCAKYQPSVVVGFPASVHANALISVAEGLGVPMRALEPPRRANLFNWIVDRHARPYDFQRVYDEELRRLRAEAVAPKSVWMSTNQTAQLAINRFSSESTVWGLLRQARQIVKHNWADVVRGRIGQYGKYRLESRLRVLWQIWGIRRRALRAKPVEPTLPADLPVIFYPFSTEPEGSLMVGASEADNQLLFVDWLAKAAPAGWRVVVKDHPAQGAPRPRRFWETLHAYPNVTVAQASESAQPLVQRARVVALVNGTLGYQAAGLGTPVLTFHHGYSARVMPHVLFAHSFDSTRAALRTVLEDKLPPIEERQLASRAFVAALDRISFPISHADMVAGVPARTPMNPAEFDVLFERLVATLPALTAARKVERLAVL